MNGLPIARIAGIEIRVQLGWVFVVALVAALAVIELSGAVPSMAIAVQWALGGVVGLAFFGSALLHDLGHAFMARRRGVVVDSMLVSFFGGTTIEDPGSTVARDDLAIAASGPLVSTLLGASLGVLALGIEAGDSEMALAVAQALAVLSVLNLLIGFVNLIPAYPLDGGRIVRALAWRRTGSLAGGWKAAATSGRVAGLVILTVGIWLVLAGDAANGAMLALSGWFLNLSSRAIRERLKVERLLGGVAVADAMERDPATISPNLTVDTLAPQLVARDAPTTTVAVAEHGTVIGMLGALNVRRLRRAAWATTKVRDVMAVPPRMITLSPGGTLLSAAERLQRSGLDGLPVLDGTVLVGVLTRRAVSEAVRIRAAAGAAGASK
ncbi:MAG: site-2 protease family protein [Chloroflexota bacterium]